MYVFVSLGTKVFLVSAGTIVVLVSPGTTVFFSFSGYDCIVFVSPVNASWLGISRVVILIVAPRQHTGRVLNY